MDCFDPVTHEPNRPVDMMVALLCFITARVLANYPEGEEAEEDCGVDPVFQAQVTAVLHGGEIMNAMEAAIDGFLVRQTFRRFMGVDVRELTPEQRREW